MEAALPALRLVHCFSLASRKRASLHSSTPLSLRAGDGALHRSTGGRCNRSPLAATYKVVSPAAPVDCANQQLPLPAAGARSFELPALHSRFPLRLGPHCESIREECEAWGLSLLGPSASPAERQAFLRGRYYLCAPVFFPACNLRHRAALIVKYYIFGFVLDDVLELSAPEPEQLAALLRAASAGWACADPLLLQVPADDQCRRLATLMQRYKGEAWQEMCNDMSPALRARLERVHSEWTRRVGSMHSSTHFHSVEEYMDFRSIEGGGYVFLDALVEYSLGIEFEEEYLASIPIVMQFRKSALNHFFWVNDLLSFRKEVIQHPAGGYGRDIIGVVFAQLQRQLQVGAGVDHMAPAPSVDLQQCVDKVWGMIQQEEVEIARLVDEIKAQFPESSDIVKYVGAIRDALANNIYWYTISGRYGIVHAKFLHGQPAGERPTIISLSPDHDAPSFAMQLT